MSRKGISFTLTLVVIGVVLLMTALTVIVVGGGEITDLFRTSGESQLSAAVGEQCSKLAGSINRNYCSMYTEGDTCDGLQRNPDTTHQTTASQENCDFTTGGGGGGVPSRVANLLNGDGEPIVTVQGNEYNCFEENEMTPTCPA
jgi:hypothetical protein